MCSDLGFSFGQRIVSGNDAYLQKGLMSWRPTVCIIVIGVVNYGVANLYFLINVVGINRT